MMNLDDTIDTAADTLRFSLVGMDADTLETSGDAADTLRFAPVDLYDFEMQTDPDATAIYDLSSFNRAQQASIGYVGQSSDSLDLRRQIRAARDLINGLRDAISEGWDVGPELVYAERRLAMLEAAV